MIITISQSRNPKLIFICFLLVILFLIKTSSAISIYELLNNTNNILKFSGEIVISFNVIIIGFIILIVVGIILNWIFKDKALIVLPFEVISSDEKYSGKAISESIVSEFNRISQIHNSGPSPIELISDVRRAFSLPLDKAKVDLENGLSSGPLNLGSGTLGFGSSSISIQELLVLLKRKFPFRAHAPIVSGTIQNCNGKLSNLIATLDETSRSKTFEIKFKDSSSLRDLAYIISFELNKEKIHTKTWRGFKHITETIYLYNKYYLNKDVNDLSHAKDECLNVIKLEPENTLLIGLIYNLSIGCLNEKLYKEAKTLLINSVEINGNEYYIINMLGIALGYLGEIEDALECFDKAIKIDPGDESAYVNKGWSLHHMGRDKESIICYEKAKEINENSSIIWDNYGVAYFALGEYKRAIECYTKAIDIEKFKWAFYNRGNAYIKLNEVDKAKKDYDDSIRCDPNFSTSMVTLARIFREEGNMDESKRYCRDARSFIHKETLYNQACFHAICDSNPEEALELLKEILYKNQQSKEYIKQDDDFKFIRDLPQFIELIS